MTTDLAARGSIDVRVPPQRAFEVWTRDIGRWWRRDTPFWNDKRGLLLRFEPHAGGRFIEVYDAKTGEGFEIGRIRVWDPPRRLVYTWREAAWGEGEITEVEVRFDAIATGTRVSVTHRGWETVASRDTAVPGYEWGIGQLLGMYADEAAHAAASPETDRLTR